MGQPPTKSELRQRMRKMLAAMPPQQRADASRLICRQVADLPAWRDARVVMCFVSMAAEVQTGELLDLAWSSGKQVLAPHVDWETQVMTAVPLDDFGLRIADCGLKGGLPLTPIRNPKSEIRNQLPAGVAKPSNPIGQPVAPPTIDLVLTPGLAFDAAGFRLGRGGGYFDRFLAQPGFLARTCGLAFECQRVAELPRAAHDVPIDMLVTEAGVIAFDIKR